MNPIYDLLLRHQLHIIWGLFALASIYGVGMWVQMLRKPKRPSKW